MRGCQPCCGCYSGPPDHHICTSSRFEREVVTEPEASRSEPADSSMSLRGLSCRKSHVHAKDVLLVASTKGWGTTFRYALLLLVRRGTVGVGAWMVFEFVQRAGLF